jgi:hypothetical protein
LAGFGVIVAMVVYVPIRAMMSDTFITLEFVIPGVLGFLPAWGVYWFFTRNDPEPDPE